MDELEKDILRTIVWFSLSEYPLTAFEIWKWMFEPARTYTLRDVVQTLSASKELLRYVHEEDGTYTLREGTASVSLRRKRFSDALRKMTRARRVMRYVRCIPFVRGVGVCNTLSWMHTRSESDIDFFIMVREGSLWITRLLVVLPFKVLRARPGERKEDPLCFSFFLSDTSLNLEALALAPKDPYLAYWIASVLPLFDRDGVFSAFQKANTWVNKTLSNAYTREAIGEDRKTRQASEWFERCASRLQRRAFPETITQMANRDSRVVVSDAMLKFHANDRREQFRDRYQTLCEIYGLSSLDA